MTAVCGQSQLSALRARLSPAANDLIQHLSKTMGDALGAPLGVAVSGGSDSTALMMGLALASAGAGVQNLTVFSVDHGLRPGAADECASVAALAARFGMRHMTLTWGRDKGTAMPKTADGFDAYDPFSFDQAGHQSGNKLHAARQARYGLIAGQARALGIGAVALGHTMDDQAEGLLMRLGRAAGVDGLAGMAPLRRAGGVDWHRPMLALRRAELRAFLDEISVDWIEDPSNEDPRFDRIRLRQAMPVLADLGLTVEALAQSATHLRSAQAALDVAAVQILEAALRVEGCDLILSRAVLASAPPETARRVILAALKAIKPAAYPPRAAALDRFTAAVLQGKRASLQGVACASQKRGAFTRLFRDTADVPPSVTGDAIWDGRVRFVGANGGHQIRALGLDGLNQIENWRETARLLDRPKPALVASPALFDGQRLISAPMLAENPTNTPGFRFISDLNVDRVKALLLSH